VEMPRYTINHAREHLYGTEMDRQPRNRRGAV
jgi:hypothetical protein